MEYDYLSNKGIDISYVGLLSETIFEVLYVLAVRDRLVLVLVVLLF